MSERPGYCIARDCDRPATVELLLTFTDGATIRLELCEVHEQDARQIIPERRAAAVGIA